MISARKMLSMVARPGTALSQIRRVRTMRAVEHVIGDEPLMPAPAVEGMRGLLQHARVFLEYGAGGSTIMAARLGAAVVSAEGDHRFADAVMQAAAERGLRGVTVLKADLGWTMEFSYPFDGYPVAANIARWRGYLELPWRALGPDRSPDLVLVDGRFRSACVAYSVLECLRRAIAPPIILDDFVGRPRYEKVLSLVEVAALWDRTAVLRMRPGATEQAARSAVDAWITDVE